MEAQQEWHFSSPDQFWAELDGLISVPPDSSLDDLDYALRNYIAFASSFMDQFLAAPGSLDSALLALLSSPLFTSHVDRMIGNIISSITDPHASSSTLFIALMLVLHLGEGANPLTTAGVWADPRKPGAGVTVGSSKVFRFMRRRWSEVVPVLMKWVWEAGVVQEQKESLDERGEAHAAMPADGWEDRVGTAATAVLYELCRVQKLSPEELADFSFEFVSHLFALVERTRDVEDETFNYSLIKLIIALNEQFMISTVPAESSGGGGKLPPPILPTVVGKTKRERGPNTVLEVLKEKEHESKTFGENIIFILNRADGTADSLCVSLLILKILYLLFTTSGTQEYFYTNDLCVLVDVFIRELYDLDEDSEGLKHTYLRVLHPLLTNTQLRHHPYKRRELRACLESLIAPSHFRDCDPTTRRLVERNLRGSWCQSLRSADAASSASSALGSGSAAGSTLSVDAVAQTCDEDGHRHKHRSGSRSSHHSHHHPQQHVAHRRKGSRRHASLDRASSSHAHSHGSVVQRGHDVLRPVGERTAQGEAPDVVRASVAAAAGAEDEEEEGALTNSPETEDAPLPPTADTDDQLSHSVGSIAAGHALLAPVAARATSRSAASHPPLAPPLIIAPRPRSHSLHAMHTHYRPAPPPPAPLSPEDPPHGATAGRRRRPPPPPTPTDGGSRPRTPAPAGLCEPLPPPSPAPSTGGTRRRPPPPPVAGAGGRGSPRAGVAVAGERDVRRGVEGLAVS
ncbi:pre-rRNA processing [Rhodotorula kratochvilovae]